jgi:hypothetical protein
MRQFSWCESTSVSFFERRRRVRRVRMIVDLTANVLRNDESVTFREAMSLVACARKSILDLVPSYEEEFERAIRPKLERLIRRRWPVELVESRSLATELVN